MRSQRAGHCTASGKKGGDCTPCKYIDALPKGMGRASERRNGNHKWNQPKGTKLRSNDTGIH
eukprot:2160167-Karenia_brevis.AAC.1